MKAYEDLAAGAVALLGVPYDDGSSFLRGAALAPPRIRQQLYSDATNLTSETGIDLGGQPSFHDLDDLDLSAAADPLAAIEGHVEAVVERGIRVLSLGGDHAVTYPILRAHAGHLGPFDVLQIDAHADLYDTFQGRRRSHASVFARAMEEGLVRRLVQVGIRTLNEAQRRQAERFGVEIVEMRQWTGELPAALAGPVYVTIDLDGLDPAFAPGVSHPEPGGLSVREVLRLLHGLAVPIVGADVVELNPLRDVNDLTACCAAKLTKELAALMLIASRE